MALVPCSRCRQPFDASCHDGSCASAPLCPWCAYGDTPFDGAAFLPDDVSRDRNVRLTSVPPGAPSPSGKGGNEC